MLSSIVGVILGKELLAGVAVLIIGYVLKKIPNDVIQKPISGLFYGLGVTVTLGLSKWVWTAPLWNRTIEPFVIDLLDNTIGCAVKKFIEGLRSD